MHARRISLVTLLALTVLSCGSGDAPANRRVTVSDSAGVRIVSHPSGSYADTVGDAPLLTIGREGDPNYELFSVRQLSALGSGNIVVANGGTTELLFYGPDGAFIRRVGRRGDGPAEFRFLTTVYTRPGDTLTVLDPQRRRLVHFD